MVTTPNFTDGTWKIVSTDHIAGDPNGDILWQNIADQSLILWQQDGATTTATSSLPSLDNYDVVAVGDLDGDGMGDAILRNSNDNRVLLSSTGTIADINNIAPEWKVRDSADVNNTGTDDIIYFNKSTAQVGVWVMDGTTLTGAVTFASNYTTADTLFSVYDGTSATSFKSLWYNNATAQFDLTTYSGGAKAVTDTFMVQAGNNFVNAGDYNGDGNQDFLFIDDAGSDAGSAEVVFTDGAVETARITYDVISTDTMHVVTGGDFDNDGIAELVLRDTTTGVTTLYNAIGDSAAGHTLNGGAGNDLIDGQDGNDKIDSGGGDDIVLGGVGDDFILTGDGNDWVRSGEGNDSVFGGNGNDIIDGDGGSDLLVGGFGDDTLKAGSGTDIVDGGDGDDYLVGGSFGFDHMMGGNGNDTIQGGSDRGVLDGGGGDDYLLGGSSLDVLFGGNGNDVIIGGLSLDTIYGGAGDDIIIGVDQAGTSGTDDTLYGGTGSDYFYLGNDDTNYYTGSGAAYIKDFSTSTTSGDWLMLNGTSGNYQFVDTGPTIEVQQASDSNVIAVIDTTATVADVMARAIYLG